MKSFQPFQIVARAFTVIDIANEIIANAQAEENSIEVWQKMGELITNDDVVCLVHSEQHTIGFLTLADDFAADQSAGELANPIGPSQLVSASTTLLDLLPLFRKHLFFFVLDKNKITHFVSYSDLDKLPTKLILFALFLELESAMLQHLTHDENMERYLNCLTESRLFKTREICRLKYKEETSARLLHCTNFIDKVNIFQADETLSSYLPFNNKKESNHFFGTLERVRNQVAHSDSILAVIKTPVELDNFVSKLSDVTSSLRESLEII